MNIAFVNQPWRAFDARLVVDTIAIVHHALARQLSTGHAVTVIARRAGLQPDRPCVGGVNYRCVSAPLGRVTAFAGLLEDCGIGRPQRPFVSSPRFYPDYARKAAAVLEEMRPDVVHLSTFYNFLPVLRRALPRAKLILHMHDHSLSFREPSLTRPMVDQADLVFGCSQHVSDRIRERYPDLRPEVYTLYNGVDSSAFRPSAEAGSGVPRLLFVGRRSPEKGLHLLLRVFSVIQRRFPGARLDIVGPRFVAPKAFVDPLDREAGLNGYRHYFRPWHSYERELKRELPERSRETVCFHGFTMPAEMPRWYRRADVLVCPSVWEEPFGLPVLEAMACGVPVVAFDRGGPRELIRDGETGRLVEPFSAAALGDAVCELLNEEGLRARMGQAARCRAETAFSWGRIASQAEQEYARLHV